MPHIEMRGRESRLADWLASSNTRLRRINMSRVKRRYSRRNISLPLADPHTVALHEAACHVVARLRRTTVAVGRRVRVAMTVRRTVVMRTVMCRFFNRQSMPTEMMHAAAQECVGHENQARQQMVKSLHRGDPTGGLSQLCAVFEAKWDCPLLRGHLPDALIFSSSAKPVNSDVPAAVRRADSRFPPISAQPARPVGP